MELSVQELQQLAFFLNNCRLTGDQSLAHAQLQIKIQQAIQAAAATKEKAPA